MFESTIYLTRNYLSSFIAMSLPHAPNLNTHSFRIGGASAALAAGASDALVRIMGRWSSDSYTRYIRVSNVSVIDFNLRMRRSTEPLCGNARPLDSITSMSFLCVLLNFIL